MSDSETKPTKRLKRLPIPGTLDHAFAQVGGRETAIAMTRLASHKDETLKEFIRQYDELPANLRDDPGILEQLCLASGQHPADYFGKICGVAYRYNFDVATFTAAVASPMVLQKAAEFAMEKGGFKDRELILKTSKVLEQHSLVNVSQTNQTVNVSSNLPQISGKISEIVRGDLPPIDEVDAIEGEIIEVQALPAHVQSQNDRDSDISS